MGDLGPDFTDSPLHGDGQAREGGLRLGTCLSTSTMRICVPTQSIKIKLRARWLRARFSAGSVPPRSLSRPGSRILEQLRAAPRVTWTLGRARLRLPTGSQMFATGRTC